MTNREKAREIVRRRFLAKATKAGWSRQAEEFIKVKTAERGRGFWDEYISFAELWEAFGDESGIKDMLEEPPGVGIY